MSGRGKAQKTLRLIDAAIRIALEIHPASVRAICYRLFVMKLIADMSKKSTDAVSGHLVWARENGRLPWQWIVDETREAERISSWDCPEDLIDSAVRQYRRDYWQMQPRRVEIWSEKGTIRGTLAPLLKEYGVTLRVMHGYGSATALRSIAEETANSDKPLIALYCGDWDPSGMAMSELDLPERLERYGGDAQIERLALDESDVAPGTALPHFEASDKAKDSRYRWFTQRYGTRCWEIDALPPPILRSRVQARIESLLDLDAWDHARRIESAETESMRGILSTWKSISGQAAKYSQGAA